MKIIIYSIYLFGWLLFVNNVIRTQQRKEKKNNTNEALVALVAGVVIYQ
jgi:hypothetical protein